MEHSSGEKEHEGERYLRLLGLEDVADQDIPSGDRTIKGRDFLDICGVHALPMLVGFESLSPDDPEYEATKSALKSAIGRYIKEDNPSQ